ncbi:MAG: HTH domain-containing protein [Limimaricola sp.]|uniref:HTH domain-containing protein n=1 Tax=Limimaricola sp. TaxID=2211665 RepID=UPI001D953520|nr:HTH domain-containing protein [Limimaricola sp.]MBI1415686.1 HTH domain-containing protein [Limimaricola sp.]
MVSKYLTQNKPKDPEGKSYPSNYYCRAAGGLAGGMVFMNLDRWWRNSKLYIDGHRWSVLQISRMADEFGVDRKTIERHVKRLEKLGALQSAPYRRGGRHKKAIRVLHDGMEPIPTPDEKSIIAAIEVMRLTSS